jgi:hypothetical protein
MLNDLIRYIITIKKKAQEYENKDANAQKVSRKEKYVKTFIIWSISLLLLWGCLSGFSESFINFCACMLSIFIGLFISALLFAFDKIGLNKEDKNIPPKRQASAEELLKDKQEYNFAKQFIYILGYNVILCTFVLILLLFCVISTPINTFNPLDYEFALTDATSIGRFFLGIFVLIQRLFVLYYLVNIFYYTLYAISSLINMMNVKRNRQ